MRSRLTAVHVAPEIMSRAAWARNAESAVRRIAENRVIVMTLGDLLISQLIFKFMDGSRTLLILPNCLYTSPVILSL